MAESMTTSGRGVRSIRERRDYIVDELARTGEVDVGRIAEELGVSPMTVRRDLSHLDEIGLVRRVHGGATLRPSPESRSKSMSTEKSRIARAVAALVEPGEVVGIDVGSTCTAVALQLAQRDDITVVTNSLHAALAFQTSLSDSIVIGGRMTPEGSLVGGSFMESREGIHLDRLILGCGGVSASRGISYHDMEETTFRRKLVEWSSKVVLAADHSKFEVVRPFILGGVDLVDILVTSETPPASLRTTLEQEGVDIAVVP